LPLFLPPIPPIIEPPDWARLPIQENGEPLVPVIESRRLSVRAEYARLGIPGASETIFVRAGVERALRRAADAMPPGVALVVFDGYRPLSVQQFLWDNYQATLRTAHPNWTSEAIEHAARQFVAAPVADPRCPPPHRTGGAVDVFLVDANTGGALLMGTEPDETSSASVTRHFEENPQEPFTTNRRVLFHTMTGAGFTNYRGEWWHFDWGNQRWANCSGVSHAVYGIPKAEPV
jgi:D-alanyl-D-alanine dipeptidase